MRWTGKKNKFSDGEIRTLKRFALFPVQLDNYQWVWLEYYLEDQKFWVPYLHGMVHWRILPQFTTIKKYQ